MEQLKRGNILIASIILSMILTASAFAGGTSKDLYKNIFGFKVKVATLTTDTDQDGNITAKLVINKWLADNTFGQNAIGWGSHDHDFSNLIGKSKANFIFKDKNGNTVLDCDVDYISQSNQFSSGYGCLGVSGGNGHVNHGHESDVLNCNSSLGNNYNEHNYQPQSYSPYCDYRYSSNSGNRNWNYNIEYNITVNKSAFGDAGCGEITVPSFVCASNKWGISDTVSCTDPGDNTQSSECDLSKYTTYTQGGWGSSIQYSPTD